MRDRISGLRVVPWSLPPLAVEALAAFVSCMGEKSMCQTSRPSHPLDRLALDLIAHHVKACLFLESTSTQKRKRAREALSFCLDSDRIGKFLDLVGVDPDWFNARFRDLLRFWYPAYEVFSKNMKVTLK